MEPRHSIELYHVTKHYPGGVTALCDVGFTVDEGALCFVLGPSGAGKSTLIRLLLRLERPSEGTVIVLGRDLGAMPARAVPFLRRQIGVVFQDFRLLPNRTVRGNAALALEVLGLSARAIDARVDQVLDAVGLTHVADAYPVQLSGGEQQRVAIARALVNDPPILLADEPTGNLDPVLSVEIINLLYDVHRRGTTVLVATHDAALAQRFPARVLRLNRGLLVGDERMMGIPAAPEVTA